MGALTESVDRAERHGLRRAPALQQGRIEVVDLDADRLVGGDRVATVQPGGEVATRAVRQGAQQVDLGEELEEVAFAGRAGLEEVDLVDRVQAGDLEDVEYVVDV